MAKSVASAKESAGYVGAGAPDLPVIAFTGGGTAGHVFPGIAVAEELGRRALWIGSPDGVEKRLAEDAGMEFRGIPAGSSAGTFPFVI